MRVQKRLVVRGGKAQERRKRLFKAALAYTGDTLESWARRHHVSTNYTRNVLHGEPSEAYTALIDQTIADFRAAVVREYEAERAKVA